MQGRFLIMVLCVFSCLFAKVTVAYHYRSKKVSTTIVTNKQSISVHLKDYILVVGKNKGLAIRQKTVEAKELSEETIHKIGKAKFLAPQGNILFASNGTKKPSRIDVSHLFQKQTNQQKSSVFSNIILIISVLIVVLLFVVYLFKRYNTGKTSISSKVEHFLYKRIMASDKYNLTIQELDALLEIDKLSSDSKKLKRHRLINELNNYYPGLIQREKDLTDKRRNIYLINKCL